MKKLISLITMLTLLLTASLSLSAPPPGRGGGNGGGDDGGDTDPPPATSLSYSFTSLGTLGGDYGYSYGINNHGDVVGRSETAIINNHEKWPHAFLNMDDGNGGREMIDLHNLFESEGFIPAFDYTPDQETGWIVSEANDINDTGQITGHLVELADGQVTAARNFRYSPTGFDVNGDPVPVYEESALSTPSGSFVSAINEYGDVSGRERNADGVFEAVVWLQSGSTIPLGLWDGNETQGTDINDDLQVCGNNEPSGRAWRYNLLTEGPYQDLGTLFPKAKETIDWSVAINNSGQVVGNSQDKSKPFKTTQRAFRYTDGEGLLDLGTLGGDLSLARAMNDSGDVVGSSRTSSGELHLFLYTDSTGMTDLDTAIIDGPGYILGDSLLVLNNNGQVAGVDAANAAYLLTPVP